MIEMELVELFGIIAPTICADIRAVYKCGIFNPLEEEKRIKLPNGYYADMYAMPMVVALAFRIDTSSAAMVRNALLERLCQLKEKQILLMSMNNRMSYECLNGVNPLWTPPFAIQYDYSKQKATNKFVKPENKNKHGVYKYSNQQGERLC